MAKPSCILVTDNKFLVSRITSNRRLNDSIVTLDVLALRESFKVSDFGTTRAKGTEMVSDPLTKPNAPNRPKMTTGRTWIKDESSSMLTMLLGALAPRGILFFLSCLAMLA